MASFAQTTLPVSAKASCRQVAARARDDRRPLIQRGFAAALASFMVAQPVMAETWQEALSHYPENPPPHPYVGKYRPGIDRAPDAVMFYTGRKMDPPKVSGTITMDELRPLIKGKKIYQVVFNEACSQVLVEYKNSDEKKLVVGLTGIDDEVVQEIMDQRLIHRITSVVPDFTKPIPIEAYIPQIKWEQIEGDFTVDVPKKFYVDE